MAFFFRKSGYLLKLSEKIIILGEDTDHEIRVGLFQGVFFLVQLFQVNRQFLVFYIVFRFFQFFVKHFKFWSQCLI